MEILYHIYDCRNNLLFFDKFVYDNENSLIVLTEKLYNKIVKSIEEPGLIMEVSNDNRMLYYFKEISHNETLLIGVKFEHGIWKVKDYHENSSSFLCY